MDKKKNIQRELDLIRVDAEAIESTDDKYYMMKKLHEQLDAIETQLELAENNNDTKNINKLLAHKKYAHEIRQYIMSRPVGRKRYGLFVEYPKGYEG